MTKKAKLFTNGGSQAVRLPAEFRFEGDSVYIRRDPATGDVILSTQSRHYESFTAVREQLGPVPDDFLSPEERGQGRGHS